MYTPQQGGADLMTIPDFHDVDWHHEAHRAHDGKKNYPGPAEARAAADRLRAEGEQVAPYRCPWGKGRHWHIGHVPSVEGLERIAAAIRHRNDDTQEIA
jgi:hypothetical protein